MEEETLKSIELDTLLTKFSLDFSGEKAEMILAEKDQLT
jgi:hypothetical protein